MNQRILGKTGFTVSEVGLGTWALGGDWGDVDDDAAQAVLRTAFEQGITLFDTADVYGDGRSERRLGRALRDHADVYGDARIVVATKAGRRLDPHQADGYTFANLDRFTARSLDNLGVEALDLVQLHCPPTDVYRRDEAFDALERLRREGRLRHYGVSVETVEEALLASERDGVASVQIIFNMFRLKPALEAFATLRERNVAVLARVPLASGLLSGSMTRRRSFPADDHRNYNRHGEAFDVGETFSGVDFETGLRAAEELKGIVPEGTTLAQVALRWILMHPAVSVVIPGAKSPQQVRANAAASALPELAPEAMQTVRSVYDRFVREQVHGRW